MVKVILGSVLLLRVFTFNLPGSAPPAARGKGHIARPSIKHKIDLWRGTSTYLRGANIWQKVEDAQIAPPFAPQDLRDLKDWGANYVNISHPGIYGVHKIKNRETGKKEYALDDALLTNLKNLITWANDEGLFVVVAFRTGPEREEKIFEAKDETPPSKVFVDNEAQQAWCRMWLKAAQELSGYKNVVGYDLMVEPNTGGHPERWNGLARRLVSQVRAADVETPILLEGADGGTPQALCELEPTICAAAGEHSGGNVPNYDPTLNLVYAVHQYEPTGYTQQTEGDWQFECKPGRNYLKDIKGKPKPDKYVGFGPNEENMLRDEYRRLGEWKRRGVPLAVNEFGVIRWAGRWEKAKPEPEPDADRFMKVQFELLEGLGVNHALWLWQTSSCEGDDDFNFQHGQFFKDHQPTDSNLGKAVRDNWHQNVLRPKDVMY
jgi:hypothetical protein